MQNLNCQAAVDRKQFLSDAGVFVLLSIEPLCLYTSARTMWHMHCNASDQPVLLLREMFCWTVFIRTWTTYDIINNVTEFFYYYYYYFKKMNVTILNKNKTLFFVLKYRFEIFFRGKGGILRQMLQHSVLVKVAPCITVC